MAQYSKYAANPQPNKPRKFISRIEHPAWYIHIRMPTPTITSSSTDNIIGKIKLIIPNMLGKMTIPSKIIANKIINRNNFIVHPPLIKMSTVFLKIIYNNYIIFYVNSQKKYVRLLQNKILNDINNYI